MHDWWTNETAGKGHWYGIRNRPATQPATALVQQWLLDADKAREAGRFADALPVYERCLATPKNEWPDGYTAGVAVDPDLFAAHRRRMLISEAQCLAALGRLDEARKIAADLRASLPAKPDLADPLQNFVVADALAADLTVPRALFKNGDAKAAADELSRISQHRPNLADLPEGMLMVDRGVAKLGWYPRGRQEDAWRAFDTLWWDVHDVTQPSTHP
jgi:hypothetical protein